MNCFKSIACSKDFSVPAQQKNLGIVIWTFFFAIIQDSIHLISKNARDHPEGTDCVIFFLMQVLLLLGFALLIRKIKPGSIKNYEYTYYIFICLFFGLEMGKSFVSRETESGSIGYKINFETLFASKFIYFSLGVMTLSIPMIVRVMPLLLIGIVVPIFLFRDTNLFIESIVLKLVSFLLLAIILKKNYLLYAKLSEENKKLSYSKTILDHIPEAILLLNSKFDMINQNTAAFTRYNFSNDPPELRMQFRNYNRIKIPDVIKSMTDKAHILFDVVNSI